MSGIIIQKKPRKDDNNYNYALSSVSAAHTYGNMSAVISNYIESFFPNYFKTTHIATKIGMKEFDFKKNTRKEVQKKEKPMLIIRPKITLDDRDTFLDQTLLTTRYTDNFISAKYHELLPFFADKERGIYIKYMPNRMVMNFEVTIITETIMEQINLASYIKNAIRQNKLYTLSTALESNVSRKMFQLLSRDSGVPMYDENKSVKRFLDYVNSHSGFPVTYKMKNSTGNDEFFRYYDTNIDIEFTDLSIDEGSKKGFVPDTAQITFNCRTEFWGVGLYYYFTKNPRIHSIKDLTTINPDAIVYPLFTMDFSYPKPELPEGYELFNSSLFATGEEMNGKETDELDLTPIMDENVLTMLEYINKNGTPVDPYMKVLLVINNKFAETDKYHYDEKTNKLIINDPNSINSYRLLIYINNLYVNSVIMNKLNAEKDINKVVQYDGIDDQFLSTIAPNRPVADEKIIDPEEPKYNIHRSLKLTDEDPFTNFKVYYGTTKRNVISGIETRNSFESQDVKLNQDINVTFTNIKNERCLICIPEEFINATKILDTSNMIDIKEQFDTGHINVDNKPYKFYLLGKDTLSKLDLIFYFKVKE